MNNNRIEVPDHIKGLSIKPKPAPDIFWEAARRINIPPHACLVFEDGDLGLDAARQSGMEVIDVRIA